jgi:hypothetical protein
LVAVGFGKLDLERLSVVIMALYPLEQMGDILLRRKGWQTGEE